MGLPLVNQVADVNCHFGETARIRRVRRSIALSAIEVRIPRRELARVRLHEAAQGGRFVAVADAVQVAELVEAPALEEVLPIVLAAQRTYDPVDVEHRDLAVGIV